MITNSHSKPNRMTVRRWRWTDFRPFSSPRPEPYSVRTNYRKSPPLAFPLSRRHAKYIVARCFLRRATPQNPMSGFRRSLAVVCRVISLSVTRPYWDFFVCFRCGTTVQRAFSRKNGLRVYGFQFRTVFFCRWVYHFFRSSSDENIKLICRSCSWPEMPILRPSERSRVRQ